MRRVRKKNLRARMERLGVRLGDFEQAGWFEGFKTPEGKVVAALECHDTPEEVADVLESYGIKDINWHPLATGYLYW